MLAKTYANLGFLFGSSQILEKQSQLLVNIPRFANNMLSIPISMDYRYQFTK